jgi:uncharacterized membrane protein
MNEIETYLEELSRELRELPQSKQNEIIAEIESHIEAGLADEDETRQARLLQELGAAQALAAR